METAFGQMYQNINAKPTPNGVIHIIKLYWCLLGVPDKAIFRSVTEYNKDFSSQCNLSAQIEQMQDIKLISR
jgi:hypothetical protein